MIFLLSLSLRFQNRFIWVCLLAVLRTIEIAKVKGLSGPDLDASIRKALLSFGQADQVLDKNNPEKIEAFLEKDNISHFILRLAHCKR